MDNGNETVVRPAEPSKEKEIGLCRRRAGQDDGKKDGEPWYGCTGFPDRHDGRFRRCSIDTYNSEESRTVPIDRADFQAPLGPLVRSVYFVCSVRSVCSGRSHEKERRPVGLEARPGAWTYDRDGGGSRLDRSVRSKFHVNPWN